MMYTTELTSQDLHTAVGAGEQLKARLTDHNDNPLVGYSVRFNINGVNYDRTTDNNGIAALNINLGLGTYTCNMQFLGTSYYSASQTTATVYVQSKINTVLKADYLSKDDKTLKQATCHLSKQDGTPIKNKTVTFTINGASYNRTTNEDGIAALNIRLRAGTYNYTTTFTGDSIYNSSSDSNTIKVYAETFLDGTNMTDYADEETVYMCAVYDSVGRVDCDVALTVNGVTYTRHTGDDGIARLNIRLPAGEYDLIARYDGDENHGACQTVNHISRLQRQREISSFNRHGAFVPADNTGFIESKIQVKQWSPEKVEELGGVVFWDDTGQRFHKDIPFNSYEITETDPRVKTARFTTSEYFDLTNGQLWVHISSPYHENFGGRILKVDFNKDNGMYTYQCQDGRRNYMTKDKFVGDGVTVYRILEYSLLSPLFLYNEVTDFTNYVNQLADTNRGAHLISGLRPIEDYDIQNGVLQDNWYDQIAERQLSYDSYMDKIMNYGHNGGCPVDIYFSPEGVCQLEPMNVEKWIQTGFKVTHSDLASYKYGFDTTNIMTGVNFQTPSDTPIINEDTGTTINEELQKLGFYFGANIGMVSPVTETVTTETSSGGTATATGANKGKTVVVGCDINDGNDSNVINTVSNKLRSAGYDVEQLSIGPGYFASYDWSGSSPGKVGVYIMAPSIVSIADAACHNGFDYLVFGLRGDLGLRGTTQFDSAGWRPDSDCTSVCNEWSGLTGKEMDEKLSGMGKGRVVKGDSAEEIANAVLDAVNGGSGSSGGTTTTEVINVAESYKKAQEEVVKSGRDLLNFEVKLPLNHTMFKNLHTNQMFFTELPKDFKLGNLAELFKILPTWKISRGAGTEYQENRWYIEKQVIKCDNNGLFSTLTLNVLPSSYSAYTEKLRSYRDAYIQAFEQKTNTDATGSGTSGSIDEVARICEQYHYKLYGDTCSDYGCMKSSGYGDCWAFAELVFEECKSRNINVRIVCGATAESSAHRYAEVRRNGSWEPFPYREKVSPASSYDGGDNWYFNFDMSGKWVVDEWTGGQDASW